MREGNDTQEKARGQLGSVGSPTIALRLERAAALGKRISPRADAICLGEVGPCGVQC